MRFIDYLISEGFESQEAVIQKEGHSKLEYFQERYEVQCKTAGEEPDYND